MSVLISNVTTWPSPTLFWLMVVVTTGALAALIYFAVQWHEVDSATGCPVFRGTSGAALIIACADLGIVHDGSDRFGERTLEGDTERP